MQYTPQFGPALLQFRCKISFRCFLIILLECRIRRQRVEEIGVKGKPGTLIYISRKFFLRIYQLIQCLQHFAVKDYGSGINIYIPLIIRSPKALQLLHCFFMQETTYISFPVYAVNAMIFSNFRWLFNGKCRSTFSIKINLQRIEQQQYISRAYQHSCIHSCSNTAHGNHKFIKQGRTFSIRQNTRYRRK